MDPSGDRPLPAFDELPLVDGLRSSWQVWPGAERLGALNLLTPARRARAAAEVVRGATFGLDLVQGEPGPPLFGREPHQHRTHPQPGVGGVLRFQDDLVDGWNTQGSTQWDGFRHVGRAGVGYYGGLDDEQHGIEHWARHGIVARGILVDVARWREHVGRPLRPDYPDAIEPEEIVATLDHQGVALRTGDVLVVRTAWAGWYRGLSPAERADVGAEDGLRCPGLRACDATARFLWDHHVAAVAGDNPCLEPWPLAAAAVPPGEQGDLLSVEQQTLLHVRLLPMLGIPIGELFDLEDLAADCVEDGRWSFLLTSALLAFPRGAASPGNCLAIK